MAISHKAGKCVVGLALFHLAVTAKALFHLAVTAKAERVVRRLSAC